MARIEDHAYMKICADLASCLSISIESARRQVEMAAAKDGRKDLKTRKLIAERLLSEARTRNSSDEVSAAAQFDQLLEALAAEENFMVED